MEIVIPQIVLLVPEWAVRVGVVVAAMTVGGIATAVHYERQIARLFVREHAAQRVGRL